MPLYHSSYNLWHDIIIIILFIRQFVSSQRQIMVKMVQPYCAHSMHTAKRAVRGSETATARGACQHNSASERSSTPSHRSYSHAVGCVAWRWKKEKPVYEHSWGLVCMKHSSGSLQSFSLDPDKTISPLKCWTVQEQLCMIQYSKWSMFLSLK